VPPQVREWLRGALHSEPSRRYRDAGEMQANWLQPWEGAGPGRSLFVGRARELEQADAVWRQACQGQAGWLLVRGDSGLGKTRYVQELGRRWGARRLYGRAAPALASASYEPLRSALTHLRVDDLKNQLDEDTWWWLKQMFPGLENLHPSARLELSLEHSMGRIVPESSRALLELGGALGYPGAVLPRH